MDIGSGAPVFGTVDSLLSTGRLCGVSYLVGSRVHQLRTDVVPRLVVTGVYRRRWPLGRLAASVKMYARTPRQRCMVRRCSVKRCIIAHCRNGVRRRLPVRGFRLWPILAWALSMRRAPCGWRCTNLVDPASSHMLVSKIKPCMSQYKLLYGETANGSLKQL